MFLPHPLTPPPLPSLKQVYASPAFVYLRNGELALVSASTKGTIALHSTSDGRQLGRLSLPGQVYSSPAVASPTRILVGCRDNNLYSISLI